MALNNQELVWYKRIATFHRAHFACSKKYSLRHYQIGIPSIVLMAATGSAIFASMESSTSDELSLTAGILALISTILVALITFLDYKERSEAHHKAGGLYGDLRTDVEYFSNFGLFGNFNSKEDFWKYIIDKFDKYSTDCPNIPKGDYDKASKHIESLKLEELLNQ